MKILCKACGIAKPAFDFYEKAGRRCKRCCIARTLDSQARNKKTRRDYATKYYGSEGYKAAARRRLVATREWVKAIKDAPCVDCGSKYPPECMDFDHRDRNQKSFNIAGAVSGKRARKSIEKEIGKCDLVCANCHRVRTAKQMGWM